MNVYKKVNLPNLNIEDVTPCPIMILPFSIWLFSDIHVQNDKPQISIKYSAV